MKNGYFLQICTEQNDASSPNKPVRKLDPLQMDSTTSLALGMSRLKAFMGGTMRLKLSIIWALVILLSVSVPAMAAPDFQRAADNTLTITNKTGETVKLAFIEYNPTRGWYYIGWSVVAPGSKVTRQAHSKQPSFYVYALSASGWVWPGWQSNVHTFEGVVHLNKYFIIPIDRLPRGYIVQDFQIVPRDAKGSNTCWLKSDFAYQWIRCDQE